MIKICWNPKKIVLDKLTHSHMLVVSAEMPLSRYVSIACEMFFSKDQLEESFR